MLEDGSVNPGQMTSFNHYALGAVADWLHRVPGGITPVTPGYGRFRFAPDIRVGLEDAAIWHDSPHGRIEASWSADDEEVRLRLLVPPNAIAEAVLPDGTREMVESGEHEWRVVSPAPSIPGMATPTLDGPMTDVVDDPRAYAALIGTLEEWNADFAHRFRRTVRWTPGRTLRDPLDKVPLATLDEITRRFAEL